MKKQKITPILLIKGHLHGSHILECHCENRTIQLFNGSLQVTCLVLEEEVLQLSTFLQMQSRAEPQTGNKFPQYRKLWRL